jgi:hypothetical protein
MQVRMAHGDSWERDAMERHSRRINIVIGEDQYAALSARGLNISGLIRDLVADYLSASTIALRVSDETRRLYDLLVANGGATDEDIEAHLKVALAKVLETRIGEMQALHKRLTRR